MNSHDGKTAGFLTRFPNVERFETFFKPLPGEVEKKAISEYREFLKKFRDYFEATNILIENQICDIIRGNFTWFLDAIYIRNGEYDVNEENIDDGDSDISNNKENDGISLIPKFDRRVEDADVSNFVENNAISRRPDFGIRIEKAGISKLDENNFNENNRMSRLLDFLVGVDDAGISNCDENNGIIRTPNFDVKVNKYDKCDWNENKEVRMVRDFDSGLNDSDMCNFNTNIANSRIPDCDSMVGYTDMCKFDKNYGIRKVPDFGVTIKTQFCNKVGGNKYNLLKCDKLTLCYENDYEAIFDYSLNVQKQTCTLNLRQSRNKFDSNSSMSNKGFVRHDDNDSNKIKTLRRALVDKFGYLSPAIVFQLRQADEKIFAVDSCYPNCSFQFEGVKNRKEKYTYDFVIKSEQQNFILGGNYVKCKVLTIHNQSLQIAEECVISFDSFDSYLKEVYCRGLIGCKKDHDLLRFGKLVYEVSWEDVYVKLHGIIGTESKDWEWFSENNDPVVPKEAETLKYRRHKTDQDNTEFLINPDKNKRFFKLSKSFIFGDHDKIAKLSPSVAEATCVIAINYSECIRNYYTVLINVIGIVLNKRDGLPHKEFLEYHPMACGGSWENKPKTGYEGIRSFAGDKLGMVDKKQLKFIQLWNEYKRGTVNGNGNQNAKY